MYIYFHFDGTHHFPRKLGTRHFTAPLQRRAAEEGFILKHSVLASERPLKELPPCGKAPLKVNSNNTNT